MFCKTNTRFYTQECKVGCFLYYLGKTPSEKSLDFCNILHGFVSKPRIIRKRNHKFYDFMRYIESHREQLLE